MFEASPSLARVRSVSLKLALPINPAIQACLGGIFNCLTMAACLNTRADPRANTRSGLSLSLYPGLHSLSPPPLKQLSSTHPSPSSATCPSCSPIDTATLVQRSQGLGRYETIDV